MGDGGGGHRGRRLVAEEGTQSKKTWVQKRRRHRRRQRAEDLRGNPIPILFFQLSQYSEKISGKSNSKVQLTILLLNLPVSSCFGPGFGLGSKQKNLAAKIFKATQRGHKDGSILSSKMSEANPLCNSTAVLSISNSCNNFQMGAILLLLLHLLPDQQPHMSTSTTMSANSIQWLRCPSSSSQLINRLWRTRYRRAIRYMVLGGFTPGTPVSTPT